MNDLSPYEFDQSDSGWRLLDAQGKYLEAAKTIENYISLNTDSINVQNEVSLQTIYFHAGQEYAMAGPDHYDKAIHNLKKSFKSKAGWDIYVNGTIAFLGQDKNDLQKASDKLSVLANADPRLKNNALLLANFLQALNDNSSYATIYNKTAR